MTIVYYLPELYIFGGLERVITFKANYFAEHFKDCHITIVTSEQQGKPLFCSLAENVDHIDLNVLFDSGNSRLKLLSLIQYPFKYYLFRRRFSRFLLTCKPDITISTLRREVNFINNIKDGSVKIGEFHGTRYSVHSAPAVTRSVWQKDVLKELWEKRFLKNLSKLKAVVLLTEEERAFWPELSNTQVIYNPIPLCSDRYSQCNSKQVVAVGRYAYEKGFDRLISSWKFVSDRHPDWVLCICGSGDTSLYVEQIKTLGIETTCLLTPRVPNIVDMYCQSSVFVLSSRYEGFGMVLIEAMSFGLPVVSFDCPCGPKEIVHTGEDGFLIEDGNIEEMAEKLCYLIENEDLRKQMGEKARLNSQRFRIEEIAKQWRSLFDSLVASRRI